MLYTCDIGNTNIKVATFDSGVISGNYNFSGIDKFFEFLIANSPSQLALSSVVPALGKEISQFIKTNFNFSPFILNHNLKFNLSIDYHPLENLGIDRICSAEGALFLFKNSSDFKSYSSKSIIVTIDLGTATTINIIKYPQIFSGGLIAPGVKMMFNSLSKDTALLPSVSENDYNQIISQDTKSSLASGVVNSTIGLIERTLVSIKKIYSAEQLKIFITGGNAKNFLPHFDFEFQFEKALVLWGIKAIYDTNIKAN